MNVNEEEEEQKEKNGIFVVMQSEEKKKDEKDFVKEINKEEVKRSSSLLKAIQIYTYIAYIHMHVKREMNRKEANRKRDTEQEVDQWINNRI